VRVATIVAGGLVVAAAGMAAVAFTAGDGEDERAASPPATATPSATPAANRDGLAVWTEHGCGSCHTLAAAGATGTFGPDLASSLKGMPASYIKESIVAPSATTAAGYSLGMMPEDYASRIPPDDLDRLVQFLRESARK
jgi:mono/diheme cytochrome c family protein